ncbi:hypothetical protein [Flavihumibacter sp. ZG627]|uniref:hypothetical protein n=1 Tax=Flavihumibacter sp. ZG627 TaxID=1463156 RepID=UPI00057E6EE6|nr:hypothetical protein [Flavihumibacter sp. ZG627]KIC90597.1 membrane protein [Flavihumibacter sp. ZG627]
MMNIGKKYWLPIVGAIVGGIAGYLYYVNIGCVTGTCAITSKPLNSTLYFAMMGALLFSMFRNEEKKTPAE